MASNYALKYSVDIVFCIDATMSMHNILDKVKAGALNFYNDLRREMELKKKNVDMLRVRIVAFRDYLADGEDAMLMTDFFTLPEEGEAFADCIKSITPDGGGDDPEDALEALAYAMRSPWCGGNSVMRRQVIVLWTDAEPHPLGFGRSAPNYPTDMARDLEELSAWWGTKDAPGFMDNRSKRLLLYAPECPLWSAIAGSWSNSIFFPSIAGEGLKEVEYREIINVIAGSI